MIRTKEQAATVNRPKATEKPKPVPQPESRPREDAKSERLIFPASPDLVRRLDDEWHRRKLRSRAETIRVLLEEALKP